MTRGSRSWLNPWTLAPLGVALALSSVGARATAAAPGFSGGARSTDGWSRLWITREQQAQRLLDAGEPGAAAKLFEDPRRRAFAELRAGDYAQAAKLLEPFHDPRSQYNRGNALARAGKLAAALRAYDAALRAAPDDRDARHNRDLVARALEEKAAQSSAGRGSRGKPGSGAGEAGRGSRGASSQGAQSKAAGSQGERSQGAGSQGANGQDASGGRPGSSTAAQAGGAQSEPGSAQQQAEQARQDAELASRLARAAARPGSQARTGGTGRARDSGSSGADIAARSAARGAAEDEAGPPVSEQTLALEQWLRRIPDDPGGLLRRKFLIEHLERQQRAQSQDEVPAGGGP